MHMADSVELIDLFSGVATWTEMATPCNCLVDALPYTHCVILSFLLFGVKVLYPAQTI